jgi:hypothetical protein
LTGSTGLTGATGITGATGPVAGSNTQVIFNDANTANGNASFTFNKTNGTVTATTFTSTVATGTSPLVVSSTTKVANLNADLLDGYDLASGATASTVVLRSSDGSIFGNIFYGTGNNLSNIQGANVSGTVSSATTAGTVTTAAQPNITSVGTLSSLSVSGNISTGNLTATGTVTAATLTETSSITLKENINPITNALDTILQLVGVTYDRKDGSKKNEAGLVAEDVEKILPNLIGYDENGKPVGIHYTKLTAYLIEAVKELTDKIKRLENK